MATYSPGLESPDDKAKRHVFLSLYIPWSGGHLRLCRSPGHLSNLLFLVLICLTLGHAPCFIAVAASHHEDTPAEQLASTLAELPDEVIHLCASHSFAECQRVTQPSRGGGVSSSHWWRETHLPRALKEHAAAQSYLGVPTEILYGGDP